MQVTLVPQRRAVLTNPIGTMLVMEGRPSAAPDRRDVVTLGRTDTPSARNRQGKPAILRRLSLTAALQRQVRPRADIHQVAFW